MLFDSFYVALCTAKTDCPLEMNKVELTPNIILFLKVEFMAIGWDRIRFHRCTS